MPRGDSFVEYILDQLHNLPGVRARRMFGAHGLYLGTTFFGIADEGRLYFKTTGATRPKYEGRGMGPFRPTEKQTLKRYYEVPADVIEDADELAEWAREAARLD